MEKDNIASQNWGYDPSYEWPGENLDVASDNDEAEATSKKTKSCFTLVVKRSSVLSTKRRVAVLDAYDEVQIGRDATTSKTIPRIRLKDMEVSKLHATFYWDREKDVWAIVDMGSKHGTFVAQTLQKEGSSSNKLSVSNGVRLSPSRHASLPRDLHHLDEIYIGSTELIVHIHSGGTPCEECYSEVGCDIPLFTTPNAPPQKNVASADTVAFKAPVDPRKAITLLKRTLLSRHASEGSSSDSAHEKANYIDRSARRRLLHPYSRPDSLGTPPIQSSPSASSSRHTSPRIASAPNSTFVNTPQVPSRTASAEPISNSNIGHRMLSKQGWTQGSALGSDTAISLPDSTRTALIEPLAVQANAGRAGLGMRIAPVEPPTTFTSGGNWKEELKRRRWEEVHCNR